MQIIKDIILTYVNEGRLTLMVWGFAFATTAGHKPEDTRTDLETVPDDWFCWLKSDLKPVVGAETGYAYFTRRGYEANKDKLKQALEAAIAQGIDRTDGGGWPAFERMAEEHFAKVEKAKQKLITSLQSKLNELNNFVV